MDASFEFYAVCPAGFERIVSEELKSQGIKRIRPLKGGVAFFGTIEDALKACLWLRSASRVLLVLARIGCASADELYEQARAIPWQEHIGPDATIAVSAHGTNRELRNTQFSAMRVKDAICDELRAQTGKRPEVSKHRPDVQINVSIHAKKATIAIDLAGEPLHNQFHARFFRKLTKQTITKNQFKGVLFDTPLFFHPFGKQEKRAFLTNF